MTTTKLAERVRELIRESGRTEYAIAKGAGLRQQTVNKITSGETQTPSASVLVPIARSLGLDPEQFGELLYECYPEKNLEENQK